MSGLATLADAINGKIHACLVVPSREAAARMHLVEKLAKIGVLVTKETEPGRIEVGSLDKVDCVVMLEACGSKSERDNVLAVAVKRGKPAFLINVKASHPSWERLADYAKRKGIANVIPINGSAGYDMIKPEAIADAVEYVTNVTAENADAIAALRASVARYEADAERVQGVIATLTKERDDANEAAQIYANERDRYAREKEEVLAAREAEIASVVKSTAAPFEAKIAALEEEITRLRNVEGKRLGGVSGSAERWKREYKKRAEDAEARAEGLELELTALRKKKGAGIDEAQLRALFNALAVKALGVDDVVRVVLRLTKGEL